MKKLYRLFLLCLLIGATTATAAQVRPGPRIVIEEMEITLLKDGKVLKKMQVSREEGVRLVSKSAAALHVEKRFIDPPILSFRDAKGTAIKKMVLKRPGKESPAGEGDWEETVASAGINGPTSRDATVSENGKYALVTEYFAGMPKQVSPAKKGAAPARRHVTRSLLKLYNAEGRMLFEEETPDSHVNKMAISSDGGVVGYIEVMEGRGVKDSASKNRLYVIDREKNLLLQFPDKKESIYRASSRFLVLSPAGRYLSVGAKKGEKEFVTLFFDLKTGTRFEASEEHRPTAIDDEGNVSMRGRKGINIKKHLEE